MSTSTDDRSRRSSTRRFPTHSCFRARPKDAEARTSSSRRRTSATSTSNTRTCHGLVSEIGCFRNFSFPSTTDAAKWGCGAIRAFHKMHAVKHAVAALVIFIAVSASAQTQTFTLDGFLSGRGVSADKDSRSWLERGPGRFDARGEAFALAQLGADWTPN